MPNLCTTRIELINDNKDELKKLYDNITEWTSKEYYENGFRLNWLGNIVGNSGLDEMIYDEYKGIKIWKNNTSCRGYITNIDHNYPLNKIILYQKDAWRPNISLWIKLLDKFSPKTQLLYSAIEPNCGIYYTNDNDIVDNYHVEISYFPDEFDEYNYYDLFGWSNSENDVILFLQDILETDESSIDNLLDMFNDSDCIDWCSIHAFKYVNENDC